MTAGGDGTRRMAREMGAKEGARLDTEKDKTLQDSVTDRVGAKGDFKILILSD